MAKPKSKQRQNRPRPKRGVIKRRKRLASRKRMPRSMAIDAIVANSGFLKCAFAPVDFLDTSFQGVPDEFNGKVFAVMNNANFTIGVSGGTETYVLLAPSPGVAYYISNALFGNYVPVYYPMKDQLFPTTDSTNVSEFRYVSSTLEITSVTAVLNTGGSISVQDLPLKLCHKTVPVTGVLATEVTGFSRGMVEDVYVDHIRNGVYTVACNKEDKFVWNPIMTGAQVNNFSITLGDDGAVLVNQNATVGYVMRGWDSSFASKLIKIRADAIGTQTIVLKTTACVEYRPSPDTLLSQIAKDSPAHNPAEMLLYHKLAHELPIAVPRAENANFWDFIKKAARVIAKNLAFIPGPIGVISGGISQLIGG